MPFDCGISLTLIILSRFCGESPQIDWNPREILMEEILIICINFARSFQYPDYQLSRFSPVCPFWSHHPIFLLDL